MRVHKSINIKRKNAIGLIHKVYLIQLKNSRRHIAFTKTRAEVRGGGRKPWKQKGTGNARAGSSRSPLWVGGGVIFGPKPHIATKKVNRKEKRLALLFALGLKSSQIRFTCFKSYEDTSILRTKKVKAFLMEQGFKNPNTTKTLVVLNTLNHSFWLGIRNLPNVELTLASSLTVKQLLHAQNILVDLDILKRFFKIYA